MDLLVLEYDDAVQRARRLAVSRERLLTNTVGPNITLVQEDLVFYVQWLVTHLHSLKSVHIFLQVDTTPGYPYIAADIILYTLAVQRHPLLFH